MTCIHNTLRGALYIYARALQFAGGVIFEASACYKVLVYLLEHQFSSGHEFETHRHILIVHQNLTRNISQPLRLRASKGYGRGRYGTEMPLCHK